MKRYLPLGLLLSTTLLLLVGCGVVEVEFNISINEDGSSIFTVQTDVEVDPESGCLSDEEDEVAVELVETANGLRCRSTESVEFNNLDELRTYFDEIGDTLVLSCLEVVDGTFYLDSTIIPEEGTEDDLQDFQDSFVNIGFAVPGEVSSSNAHSQAGNTLVWTITTETPVAPFPMVINMEAGDSCPPESVAGEEENGEAEEESAEEESDEEDEALLNPFAFTLPAGLEDQVFWRMGCTVESVNNGDCPRQDDALRIAKQIEADISSQLPNPSAAVGMLFYIHVVSTYAYSRDVDGELIFPSLNASLPVVIQLAWNSIDSPELKEALYRFVATLIDYDNQRYAADHGE